MSLGQILRLPLTLLICFALVLPGCASLSGESDDPSDICLPERTALRSTGNFFAKDIIEGAAIGAIGGAIVGGLLGGGRGALAGALAGGVAGAAGGYLRARAQQAQGEAQLYRTVYSDIDRENLAIDKTQYAFNKLVACRNTEASRIRADYRAGRISRAQAEAAMGRVRALAESDLRLARSISEHIQQRSNDYSTASQELERGYQAPGAGPRPTARRPARPPQAVRQVEAASSTNLAKRDQFQQSIARAQANTSAFELSPT